MTVGELRKAFNIGDEVIRRPGTLGADGERGTVLQVEKVGAHTLVTVRFTRRTERFIADTYIRA